MSIAYSHLNLDERRTIYQLRSARIPMNGSDAIPRRLSRDQAEMIS